MYLAIIRAKTTPKLVESLAKFRECVSKLRVGRAKQRYAGWPPKDAIYIAKNNFGPLDRTMFVINRILPTGVTREPTLVICCGNTPVLMFNRHQFESFLSHLPWIKTQLSNQYKLI
ncbi:conserved Plasmodium protein, unknown function [Babesia microti strain RI]|uniref:Uncharacterized protein n=1 Tax=Babesia microti (strain RI) TaxID=1133968 RepID=A0A1R4AC16_BABMR|nr:conserved Plasmodium protein, unknown function [Babesia microti strain RI]SJK86520.1 conserved Plasmodium protein, unknown function [Babesia microti strain RI]|eukprot:XP_021338670.1 conserved Plasmodium protein, unknown function [Babesia microti strain RI]